MNTINRQEEQPKNLKCGWQFRSNLSRTHPQDATGNNGIFNSGHTLDQLKIIQMNLQPLS